MTRRLALSRLNAYFDPLGLWSPFFVALKLCYSRIVEDITGWDDYVNTELTHEWNLLLDELASLSSLSVPRQYSSLVDGECELHLFCDASQYALCACVYLRVIQGNLFDSALVVARCRLISHSQINKFFIARKELVALCVGVDMLKQCEQFLTIRISKTYMWVDSTTVIKWCQCKQKQLAQFVRNRVDKILRSTNNQVPDYINTKTNPADIGSRGIRFKQRKKYEMWCVGPLFLRKPEECWQVGVKYLNPTVNSTEISSEFASLPTSHLNVVQVTESCYTLRILSESSSSMEAEHSLILLQQCFDALKITRADAPPEEKKEQNCHHKAARLLLLQLAQNETLGKIISEMRDKKLPVPFEQALFNKTKNERPHYLVQLLKFVPFLENDHLLRIGGRLQFHEFSFDFQHPVLLPHRHWTTELYVRKKHVECGHLGHILFLGVFSRIMSCGRLVV